MEQLGGGFGYVLYTTQMTKSYISGSTLSLSSMQDRALVYHSNQLICILGLTEKGSPMSCQAPDAISIGDPLAILVENKGRPSGEVTDFEWARKGIWGNVTLNGDVLSQWQMFPFSDLPSSLSYENVSASLKNTPAFWRGYFSVEDESPSATFLNTPRWGRGVMFVNGFNVGRFTDVSTQKGGGGRVRKILKIT